MPFQSRLLTFWVRQTQRWQDRAGQLWRRARLQATWTMEVLLYPLRGLGKSLGQGFRQGQDASLGEAPQQQPHNQPQPKIGRFLNAAGRSLQQFLSKQAETLLLSRSVQWLGQWRKQPVQHLESGSERVDSSAITPKRTSALRWLRPLETPLQAIAVLAKGTVTSISRLNFARWRTVAKVALGQHRGQGELGLQRDGETLLPFLKENDVSKLRGIWGLIQAAMTHFFGTGPAKQRLGGFSETSRRLSFRTDEISTDEKDGLALPASSFSMALIPGVERLVINVLRVIGRGIKAVIPWIRGDRPPALPTPSVAPLVPPRVPSSILLQSQGLGLMAAPAPFRSIAGSLRQGQNGAHWDDWRRLIAPESASQSPLQTTLIEAKATVIGYVESPLRVMGKWLDGAMRWLEDAVLGGVSWLWRWVQQLQRHWINFRS